MKDPYGLFLADVTVTMWHRSIGVGSLYRLLANFRLRSIAYKIAKIKSYNDQLTRVMLRECGMQYACNQARGL